jgi:hypothetical protein
MALAPAPARAASAAVARKPAKADTDLAAQALDE